MNKAHSARMNLRAVNAWNAVRPIGTPVIVKDAKGNEISTITTREAWLRAGCIAVVDCSGFSVAPLLSNVRVANRPEPEAA